MAIRRVLPTGVATGGSGADYAANACGTINEASAAATDTYLLASTDTAFTGLTFACAKGTAATPNRYLDVATGALSSFGALIADCLSTSGWIANPAGDVGLSYLVATHTKNGTGNKMKLTFDAVPQANTMQAYCPVANLSLAAFQNVCSFMQDYVGTCPANSLVIKLCTGNDGVTGVVATMTWAEAMAALSVNTPVCLNNGAALANGINSIAIYTGAVAPAASSVWAFDTFYATIAGFDLNSMPHKSFNYRGAAWAPLTNYAVGTKIVPTFGARSPLVFEQMAAAGGVSAATEYFTDADGQLKAIWDKAYLPAMGNFAGQLVTDGTCIWKCLGDDEAYYFWAIKSLDFTANGGKGRIEIDNHPGNVGNAGRGYYGTDETVAMSYLTPYLYPMAAAAATVMDSIGASGTDAVPRTISGGYNTSDVVVGVTFISGRNGLGYLLQNNAKASVKITGGIGFVRGGRGIDVSGLVNWMSIREVIGTSNTNQLLIASGTYPFLLWLQHVWAFNNTSTYQMYFILPSFRGSFSVKAIGGLGTTGVQAQLTFYLASGMIRGLEASNSTGYGVATNDGLTLINAKTSLNLVAGFVSWAGIRMKCKNLSVSETVVLTSNGTNYGYGAGMLVQNFGGVIGDNRAYYPSMGQATYNSTTHVWTIAVNNVNATQQIPLRHELGPVRVDTVGVPCTISVQVNPSAANIKCQLKIPANVIAGVQFDTYSESSGSGLQTLTTTFTPLEAGIFKPVLDCSINDTTLTSTIAFDLDSFAATQNGVALAVAGIGDQLFGEEMFVSRGDVLTLAQEAARNISAGAANFLVGVTERIQGVDIPGALSLSYINTITPTGSAVAGGATATITGSGFSVSGNTVAFGSAALGWTAATIITETATSISVVIPAGSANTVGVRVTNALAQVATLTNCFVYYATPTSHVKQRIIDAIIYGLGQITENNGYNYTIRRVYDPPTGFTEMEEFPAVNVYDGEETCANGNIGSHLQTGGNNAMLHNSFVVTLDCVLTTTPNQATARQDRYKFLADVQKYFGKNYWIPNEYSEGTARCCFYQRSTPFGIESNRNDITGISIDFIVWYDQELTNPTSRG